MALHWGMPQTPSLKSPKGLQLISAAGNWTTVNLLTSINSGATQLTSLPTPLKHCRMGQFLVSTAPRKPRQQPLLPAILPVPPPMSTAGSNTGR